MISVHYIEKPIGHPTRNDYRYYSNRAEPNLSLRREMAKTYRVMRADKPWAARLLFTHQQSVAKKLRKIFNSVMDN